MLVDPSKFRPSGRLRIKLSHGAERDLKNRWEDGRVRLEQQLDQVVAEAAAHAAARKSRQHGIERRRVEQAEARQQKLEAGANDQAERRRCELLRRKADLHEEVEHLARYVRHLRLSSTAPRSEDFANFLEWAESHVEVLRVASSLAGVERELVTWSAIEDDDESE
jgi:hypothetical protein